MANYATLIADAGSTKIDWAYLSSDGTSPFLFQTQGLNALIADREDILGLFRAVAEQLGNARTPSRIFYYGAGCATEAICSKVAEIFSEVFPDAKTEVASDLVGAARSLLGNSAGIACILGTGSNSALYDGKEIRANVPPLGYILGDEGSGTALGKRLINEIFKGGMDEKLRDFFITEADLSLPSVLEGVYRSATPNKFLASLVPFIRKQAESPFIKNMVIDEFRKFFQRNVARYEDAMSLPVAFTGSVAYHFEAELREAATLEGFAISRISAAPMKGLIEYHSEHLMV